MYVAIVYETDGAPGVSHRLFAHDDEGGKRAGWKWLDCVMAGGRVVAERDGERVGAWIHYDGRDEWVN